eukprot:TRINITY_DN405_c0_g1_i4.p1 TRINITY_DN405_c0_g1~~TRINITY_DN405_c0_g1_i4.p1  ORF type:complete len:173 (-),score=39.22 TRINITY_DN405_c0_g1_i4:162-680(-)
MLEEIDRVSPNIEDPIEYKQLKQFTYVDWVVQEGLRLYPPAPTAQRVCQEDIEIGGHLIPKNTTVHIPIWSVHHDDRNYRDPEKFDPQRWDPESDEFKKRHPMAWIPFTEGPRKCIGYRFALEELKIVLVNLYKNFTFTISERTEEPLKFRPHITLVPETGVYMVPHRRGRK